ncbi:MAG: hydrogenase maturation protease [Anaerolineae bacterium]|nr:hydrogenase maturation protease [Anaerolineae bacterium]
MRGRILVCGFGNVYRRDDGAGYAVINALRERLGRPPLDLLDDGFTDLGHTLDTIVLHQLMPELAETLADYDLVVFIDAHMGNVAEEVREERLEAAHRTPFVHHQMHPATLLALAQQMYGRAPVGILLSVRGYDFDFGTGLSPETAALVPWAVERIMRLAEELTGA